MSFNYCCKFPYLRCLLGVLATPRAIFASSVTFENQSVKILANLQFVLQLPLEKFYDSRRKIIPKEKLNCIPHEKGINSSMSLSSKYFYTVSYSLCARTIFKACVHYFYQIFIFFTKRQPFKNYEKYFLFHQLSSFCSRDNQIFLFPCFPLFLPVSHCFRG